MANTRSRRSQSKRRSQSRKQTRSQSKNRKGSILDVRSLSDVNRFENLMTSGPLTMVLIKAKWCGACHRFNDEVWNSLTQLKNRNMNMASVDSEVIGNTSLANVPRKFYPTLLLVGKDKKPAVFMDEDGTPTNAMPRSKTLSEDREALSALIQNPTPNLSNVSPQKPTPSLVPEAISFMKSPYVKTTQDTSLSSLPERRLPERSLEQRPLSSTPPDIGADLIASQSKATTATAATVEPMKGGRLLRAIRSKTSSLKAMLHLRKPKKTRRARHLG